MYAVEASSTWAEMTERQSERGSLLVHPVDNSTTVFGSLSTASHVWMTRGLPLVRFDEPNCPNSSFCRRIIIVAAFCLFFLLLNSTTFALIQQCILLFHRLTDLPFPA